MTIPRAQLEKSKIEEAIIEMLNDFELKTGCFVSDVNLDIKPGMIKGRRIHNVDVVVRI